MNALRQLAGEAKLIVVVGPGGVGKTTTAAAIAATLAASGKRTLVLTADPARRLADALGIAGDTADALQVAPNLWASMLESERTFAALLPRMVPSDAARARIQKSPVYQRFSRSLGRSHAYAAIERLHSAAIGEESARYEVIVLDTPPMRGVLDLLDAPEALGRFAGSRAVDVFAGDGSGFFGWAARRALSALTGPELGAGLTEFLAAFAPFRAGFAERAARVADLQRAPSTTTVLVTSGQAERIADARALTSALAEREVHCRFVIGSGAVKRSSRAWTLPDDAHGEALRAAHTYGVRARELQARETAALASLSEALGIALILTATRADEPTSIEALRELASTARGH
jgi:anion-transporting  ArsA/GET3 family ATPase